MLTRLHDRLSRRHHDRLHWRGAGHDILIQGRGSRVYDWAARLPFRAFYRRLATDVAEAAPPGGAVLDVGTGPGLVLTALARQRPDLRVTGIDLSADMVALATRNVRRAGLAGRVDVRQADVAALPFPDATFDLVVSSLSMHHWGEVTPGVTELARMLRPGGTLRIYDFRTLPDDVLTAAASVAFEGRRPQRTNPARLGLLPGRMVTRWTLTRPAETGAA